MGRNGTGQNDMSGKARDRKKTGACFSKVPINELAHKAVVVFILQDRGFKRFEDNIVS